jgi:hypothetical protein
MSERQPGPYDSIARKWLSLAERRREHFLELLNSDRWRHYYTELELQEEMHKAALVRDRWAKLAGVSPDDEKAEPVPKRRTAA